MSGMSQSTTCRIASLAASLGLGAVAATLVGEGVGLALGGVVFVGAAFVLG